jgi:hypothetical protein
VVGHSATLRANQPTNTNPTNQDALEYGLIDEVIQPNAAKAEKAAGYWLKSGRAESDGRLEQWKEYLELQEKYSMADQFKKVCWVGGCALFGCHGDGLWLVAALR